MADLRAGATGGEQVAESSFCRGCRAIQDFSHSGVKRGYSALGEDPYGDSKGNPHARLDNSLLAGGSSVFGGLSQQQY